MSYRPLADVRKDLRVEWYRCPVDGAKLRELSRRSDLQGWFQAGGHLALFLTDGSCHLLLLAAADLGRRCHRAVVPRNRGNVLSRCCGP